MIAATIALIILSLLAVFQAALIAGAPLGHYAWGGKHKVLPRKFRLGSYISIFIYIFFAVLIVSKVDLLPIISRGALLDVALWIVFIYFVIGVFMNAVSRSKPERYTMTPVALVLAACLFFVASS